MRSSLITPMPSDEDADRAARFLDTFSGLYQQYRHGAKWLRRRPNLEWVAACDLCRLWDDERLRKMAIIVLTTDDDWIARTDRGFSVFVSRASWADERLAAWEAQQKASA